MILSCSLAAEVYSVFSPFFFTYKDKLEKIKQT